MQNLYLLLKTDCQFILYWSPGTRTVVDTEVVGGEEAEVGKEIGGGEGTTVGSSTGTTEAETATGTPGKEAGMNRALQTTTRDTTPIIRDHIMTATDLYSNLSAAVSIRSVRSYNFHCNTTRCATAVFVFGKLHFHSLISKG